MPALYAIPEQLAWNRREVIDDSEMTYPYNFLILSASDMEVYADGVLVGNYNLTNVGDVNGGNVVFTSGYPEGTVLVFRRRLVRSQPALLSVAGVLPSATLQSMANRNTLMVQDLYERALRTPALPVTVEDALRDLLFPLPGALQVIGWNADGTALTLFDSTAFQVIPDPISPLTWGYTVKEVIPQAGEAIASASAVFPAGSLGMGALLYVAETCGSAQSLMGMALGIQEQPDKYGANINRLIHTTTTPAQWARIMEWLPCRNAQNVQVTAEGGLFDGTGRLLITGIYLMIAAKTSLPGGQPPSGSVDSYTTAFTSVTSLSIPGSTHLLGTADVLIQCYDTSSPPQLLPEGAFTATVDQTSFDITLSFVTSQSGTVYVLPATAGYSFTNETAFTIAGTTHGLGTDTLLVQVYDALTPRTLLGPVDVTIDPVTFDIVFSTLFPQSGRVVILDASTVGYTTTFTNETAFTISGVQHALGTAALLIQLYDDSSPAVQLGLIVATVDPASFDVVMAFVTPQSGRVVFVPVG